TSPRIRHRQGNRHPFSGRLRDRVRVSLSRPETAGTEGLDRRQVGNLRAQPAGPCLPPDAGRPQATGGGAGPMEPDGGRPGRVDGERLVPTLRRLRYLLPGRRAAEEREMTREFEALRELAVPAELGNLTLAAENARAVWGWAWADSLLADIRYALRI